MFPLEMNPQRLFLAIPVSEKLKKTFIQCQIQNRHLEKLNLRWTPEANFHVTLFFLGNILPHNIRPLTQTLQNVFTEVEPFSMEFEKYLLPYIHDPRMIWARFRENKKFFQLSKKTFQVCKKFMEDRLPHSRNQIPHVTMSRMKDVNERIDLIQSPIPEEKLHIDHVELWLSVRKPNGVHYESLASFPFREN